MTMRNNARSDDDALMGDVRFSDNPDDTGTHRVPPDANVHSGTTAGNADTVNPVSTANNADSASNGDTAGNASSDNSDNSADRRFQVYSPQVPYGAMLDDVKRFIEEHPEARGKYYEELAGTLLADKSTGSADKGSSAADGAGDGAAANEKNAGDGAAAAANTAGNGGNAHSANNANGTPVNGDGANVSSNTPVNAAGDGVAPRYGDKGDSEAMDSFIPSGDDGDNGDPHGLVVPTGVNGNPEYVPVTIMGAPQGEHKRAGATYGDEQPVDGRIIKPEDSAANKNKGSGDNAGDTVKPDWKQRFHVNTILKVLFWVWVVALIVILFIPTSSATTHVSPDSEAWTETTEQARTVLEKVDEAQDTNYGLTLGATWFNGTEWLVLRDSEGVTVSMWKAETVDGIQPNYKLTMMADGSYTLQYSLGDMDGSLTTDAPAVKPVNPEDSTASTDSTDASATVLDKK